MKKISMLACAFLLLGLLAGCGTSKTGETVVEINGHKVTTGDLDFLGTINPRIKAQLMHPEGKKKIVDNYVEQELLYQEAVKKGINRKADVKDKVDLYRRVIIAQALVDDEMEKESKKYYEEHPNEFQKLQLARIMIKYYSPDDIKKLKKEGKFKPEHRTDQEAMKLAQEIKTKLDEGADFVALAKEVSEDPFSKNRGGDMGLIAKNEPRLKARGEEPLVEKAFTMKVGEIAGPIKTNNGYNIITVTRGVEVEPFDQAQFAIMNKMQPLVRAQLIKRLKDDSKIVFFEEEKQVAEEPKTAKAPAENKKPVEIQIKKPEGMKTPAEKKK